MENLCFLHDVVAMPCEVTAVQCWAMYRMFMFNTPFSVFDDTNDFTFRFLFTHKDSDTTVRVNFLTLLPFGGGPPLYPDLLL